MKNGQTKIIDHLSASQVKTFNVCEVKWYYNKILGLRVMPNGARVLGSAFDEALNFNFEQKIKTGLDLKPDIVVDNFQKQFKSFSDEADFGHENKSELRETGINLIKLYQEKASPFIRPRLIQPEFNIKFEGVEWDFISKPDIIELDGTIIDNKTSTRSPKKDLDGIFRPVNLEDKFQVGSYDLTVNVSKQVVPKKLMIIYAIKKKEPEIIKVHIDPMKPTERKYWTIHVSQTAQRMELIKNDKLSPKPNRSHNLCSRTWCGFWGKCEKQFGGIVRK